MMKRPKANAADCCWWEWLAGWWLNASYTTTDSAGLNACVFYNNVPNLRPIRTTALVDKRHPLPLYNADEVGHVVYVFGLCACLGHLYRTKHISLNQYVQMRQGLMEHYSRPKPAVEDAYWWPTNKEGARCRYKICHMLANESRRQVKTATTPKYHVERRGVLHGTFESVNLAFTLQRQLEGGGLSVHDGCDTVVYERWVDACGVFHENEVWW